MEGKGQATRKWLLLSASSLLLVTGGGLTLYGTMLKMEGMIMVFLGVPIAITGGILLLVALKQGGIKSLTGAGMMPAQVSQHINCLKIYPDKVFFDHIDKPLGVAQQCLNDGKWYHVHIFDKETGGEKAFTLPDEQYYDPTEFANVVEVPAHKKLFEHIPSLLENIAPWAMVVAILIVGFLMLVIE